MTSFLRKLVLGLAISAIAFILLLALSHYIPDSSEGILQFTILLVAVLTGVQLGSYTISTAGINTEMGTVKWFNTKKGYGFITRDQGDDVFVHYRNIVGKGRKTIAEGQRVKFIVINGDKGLQADEVETI